jgi:hypothetical protein
MKLPKKQRGMTILGWLAVISIVGGITTIGVRLVPHYMDFNTAVKLLDSMTREPDMINKRTSDMVAMYTKRLKLNGIYDFQLKERLKIKRGSEKVKFRLAYEVREPIMTNMFVLLIFEHEVELVN